MVVAPLWKVREHVYVMYQSGKAKDGGRTRTKGKIGKGESEEGRMTRDENESVMKEKTFKLQEGRSEGEGVGVRKKK